MLTTPAGGALNTSCPQGAQGGAINTTCLEGGAMNTSEGGALKTTCIERVSFNEGAALNTACPQTWGAGVETQENKKIFVPLSKKDNDKKSHERWT